MFRQFPSYWRCDVHPLSSSPGCTAWSNPLNTFRGAPCRAKEYIQYAINSSFELLRSYPFIDLCFFALLYRLRPCGHPNIAACLLLPNLSCLICQSNSVLHLFLVQILSDVLKFHRFRSMNWSEHHRLKPVALCLMIISCTFQSCISVLSPVFNSSLFWYTNPSFSTHKSLH